MRNKFIDFDRLNKQIAQNVTNLMYENITDEEWATLAENRNSPFYLLIEKIQDEIYNYYVSKLIGELQAATKVNKQVDASIYGGILEGIYESNIRTLCEEGCKRQENRTKENLRNKA